MDMLKNIYSKEGANMIFLTFKDMDLKSLCSLPVHSIDAFCTSSTGTLNELSMIVGKDVYRVRVNNPEKVLEDLLLDIVKADDISTYRGKIIRIEDLEKENA